MKNLNLLRLSGIISFVLAIFQTIISFSPAWSLYFGAPPEITDNPPLLIVTGLIAFLIFIIFGLYGLSGAGDIRPFPFLRSGLIIIGGIYTVRGMMIFLELLILFSIVHMNERVTSVSIMSSFVSLLIGIIYLTGTIKNWQGLTQPQMGNKN